MTDRDVVPRSVFRFDVYTLVERHNALASLEIDAAWEASRVLHDDALGGFR